MGLLMGLFLLEGTARVFGVRWAQVAFEDRRLCPAP